MVIPSSDVTLYSKTCFKRSLKRRPQNMFSRQIIAKCRSKVLQNAPPEHSAILSTCTKLSSVFKTFVLSIFVWLLKIGFTVFGSALECLHYFSYLFYLYYIYCEILLAYLDLKSQDRTVEAEILKQ